MTTLHTAAGQFVAGIQEPQTADTYRWALDAMERFLVYGEDEKDAGPDRPPYPISELETGMLEAFYLWMSDGRYARQSIKTYMAATRRFLHWLDARDELPVTFQLGKALSRLKEIQGQRRQSYKHRRVDPDLPEVVLYYDKLQLPEIEDGGTDWKSRQERLILLRNRAIVHTLYASGGRVSEVASLTREMVLGGRLTEAHLQGKGGYTRVILFTPDAMNSIRVYLCERKDTHPALFISHGRNQGDALSRCSIWRVVKRAAGALDLYESTSPHSFRHYRATQLLNEGMPLESVQAYLGHQDIATTRMVYAHTHTAVLRDQLATFGLTPAQALQG